MKFCEDGVFDRGGLEYGLWNVEDKYTCTTNTQDAEDCPIKVKQIDQTGESIIGIAPR